MNRLERSEKDCILLILCTSDVFDSCFKSDIEPKTEQKKIPFESTIYVIFYWQLAIAYKAYMSMSYPEEIKLEI